MEHIFCDVLVVGSGSAGLRAAISAKQKGLDVCVISKHLTNLVQKEVVISDSDCLYGTDKRDFTKN